MPRKRILYTSHISDMHYGGQISLYHLVKRLDRQRFEPLLVSPAAGSLSHAFNQMGCDTVFFSFPHIRAGNLARIPPVLAKTLHLLKTRRISLVHADHPTDTFYLGLCARLLRIPLLWHARTNYQSRLDPINLRLATKVIGVSRAVSRRFMNGNRISPKYMTIYNGVDIDVFRPGSGKGLREALKLDSDVKVVTTIGQMIPDKGIDDFLAAAKLVVEQKRACRFLMVGGGEDTFLNHMKRRIREKGLEKYVRYLGLRTDIQDILHATDVFVLASRPGVEGLPRVVIEAMSCARPVVGTNVHGINEAVEDGITGLLVPPGDPQDLAGAILDLLVNGEKSRRMGKAGRERVKERFSIGRHVSRVERLYEQIMEKAAP